MKSLNRPLRIGILLGLITLGTGFLMGGMAGKFHHLLLPTPFSASAAQNKPCKCGCTMGKCVKVAVPIEPRLKETAIKKVIEYHVTKYGQGNVSGKASNYACHIRVDIYTGDRLLRSYAYRNGVVREL